MEYNSSLHRAGISEVVSWERLAKSFGLSAEEIEEIAEGRSKNPLIEAFDFQQSRQGQKAASLRVNSTIINWSPQAEALMGLLAMRLWDPNQPHVPSFHLSGDYYLTEHGVVQMVSGEYINTDTAHPSGVVGERIERLDAHTFQTLNRAIDYHFEDIAASGEVPRVISMRVLGQELSAEDLWDEQKVRHWEQEGKDIRNTFFGEAKRHLKNMAPFALLLGMISVAQGNTTLGLIVAGITMAAAGVSSLVSWAIGQHEKKALTENVKGLVDRR